MLVLSLVLAHLVGAVVLLPDFRPVFGMLVGLYTVAAHCRRIPAVVALLGAYGVSATVSVLDELSRPLAPMDTPGGVARAILGATLVLDLAAWGGGRWARASRQHAQSLRQLAELQRREAVAAERAGIARDMHDTVSAAITAVLLHAAGARRVLTKRPDAAADALERIEAAAGQAMSELREMLQVLRAPDEGGAVGAPTSDAGIASMRALGLRIEERVIGAPRPLPAEVAEAAAHVVREALTNSAKYAGAGAAVVVEQQWAGDHLQVTVTDDGAGRRVDALAAISTGAGLAGLRERAAVVGGRVRAGPTPDGGFAVSVHLPLTRPSRERVRERGVRDHPSRLG